MRRSLPIALLFLLGFARAPAGAAEERWPSPPREFRGVWVATVSNIDWPSRPGLPTAVQQKELLAILDRAVELRLNAVILQVRPMADALYASRLEPWSEFLTGQPGRPPDPYYDPLEFAVGAAHVRGLELHAWFNPYRARHPSAAAPAPAVHLVKRRPDLAKPYGKHHWLNPTHPEVQDHSIGVILDVVRRYDIDGVHMDDYFYPYKEKDGSGQVIPFPDDDTWAAYRKAGGKMSRDDWRRDAVNRFVARLYKEVKAAKPWVKVGISPFGIWRPGHPPGIAGFDQYAELYADARHWLNEGWVDYFTPQLYWPIKQEKQSYPRLLAWWAAENTRGRHLWPGNIPSRVTGTAKGWPAGEIADQIKATRAQQGATGNVHFSMKPLMLNTGGVADALKEVYAEPALVPASPWLGKKTPAQPRIDWQDQSGRPALRIRPAGESVRLFVVRSRSAGKWAVQIHPARGDTAVVLPFTDRPEQVVVTAVDRVGNESEPAVTGK
jgi:uncharacterized lipoprotein YddW (UPF0748 family)